MTDITDDLSGGAPVPEGWQGSVTEAAGRLRIPPEGLTIPPQDKGWTPTVREGETLEDVPLSRWIGEALGAASMCWRPRPTGEFDSSAAAAISEAVHSHVQSVIDGVIEGERQHSVQRATTRELLTELAERGEAIKDSQLGRPAHHLAVDTRKLLATLPRTLMDRGR